MDIYFSQYFGIDRALVEDYGAFDISVISDLPLFIDPFLLFNSEKDEYTALHAGILKYLTFLREKSVAGGVTTGLLRSWYHFKEVKQNWLGFTVLGNEGHALGDRFAQGLNKNLNAIFSNFGTEKITKSSHLEKVALIGRGVGRDSISDFTTCLIKHYLLEYTETFAKAHLKAEQCGHFKVERATFNYKTESWEARGYTLPVVRGDFVLLTPTDLLTKDDTWISPADLQHSLRKVIPAIPDVALRDQISNYFEKAITTPDGGTLKGQAFADVVWQTITDHPELIDYYIRYKEDHATDAVAISEKRVADTRSLFVEQVSALYTDLGEKTAFFNMPGDSLDEALARVQHFKQYVENQEGYKLLNKNGAKPFASEKEVQLFFGIVWFGSKFDVNREPNNGGGPVDFKVSLGSKDKSLIEFKLASNSKLKQNLQSQLDIYGKANGTKKNLTVILCYTHQEQTKVATVLEELGLEKEKYIVVIDARADNKPTGSHAKPGAGETIGESP